MDFYNFYTGKEFEAHEFLGAHVSGNGTTFRTFAPAASHIAVIGEFNNWTDTPMYKIHDGNYWECFISEAKAPNSAVGVNEWGSCNFMHSRGETCSFFAVGGLLLAERISF